MRAVGIVAAGLVLPLGAAAPSAAGTGNAAFQFLNLGTSPRLEALGEAGATLARGADGLVWNPAWVGESGTELTASYFNWLADTRSGSAAAAWPLGKSSVGIGVRSLTVDEFSNVPGEPAVGQSDLAVAAGGSYPLGGSLLGGAALQVIRSSLGDQDASGWAATLGAGYRWVEGWDLALAARNLGPSFGYVGGVEEELPQQISLGLASTFGELRMGSEVLWEEGQGAVGVLGAEFEVRDRLALRLGSRLGDGAGAAREPWAVGLGVAARRDLDLEYAFRDGALDASHRLGIRWVPGRSLGGPDEEIARSPREFYVDVLNEALERSLVTFPQSVDGKLWVRSSAEHEAEGVISEILAERLRQKGMDAAVAAPPVSLEGLDEATIEELEAQGALAAPEGAMLEYDILASEYEIVRAGRKRWVGPRSVDRVARVDLTLELLQPGAGEPAWSSTAAAESAETVTSARIPESSGYPAVTKSAGASWTTHPLVEPAIVGTLVTGLAVIFFANRDVGQ